MCASCAESLCYAVGHFVKHAYGVMLVYLWRFASVATASVLGLGRALNAPIVACVVRLLLSARQNGIVRCA